MTARYMIYLPAAARGDELIGFAKPVCETICAEWGIRLGGEEE